MKVDVDAKCDFRRLIQIKASAPELGQPPVENLELLVLFTLQELGGVDRCYRRRALTHYCCERMADDLNQVCDQHPDRHDCPDALIHYSPELREYGLYIHDGGSSIATIEFCPWCGADLRRITNHQAAGS